MAGDFVTPEVKRIPLANGRWVEVKEQLNFGENQKLAGAIMAWSQRAEADSSRDVSADWLRYRLAKFSAWLTDWSLKGSDDRPVPLSADAIAALTQEAANEIETAINKHIAEQETLKNSTSGAKSNAPAS